MSWRHEWFNNIITCLRLLLRSALEQYIRMDLKRFNISTFCDMENNTWSHCITSVTTVVQCGEHLSVIGSSCLVLLSMISDWLFNVYDEIIGLVFSLILNKERIPRLNLSWPDFIISFIQAVTFRLIDFDFGTPMAFRRSNHQITCGFHQIEISAFRNCMLFVNGPIVAFYGRLGVCYSGSQQMTH